MSFIDGVLGGMAAGIGILIVETYGKPFFKKTRKTIKNFLNHTIKKIKTFYNNL